MTNFIFIRHGEPDYSFLKDINGSIAIMSNFAPLSLNGEIQAKIVAKSEALKDSEVLVSSPYTRTMQTSSIISNEVNLPINVEVDLHEWIPDFSYKYSDRKVMLENYNKAVYDSKTGIIRSNEYESFESVKLRTLKVIRKYLNYKKVLVVAHQGVIYSLTNELHYFCEPYQLNFDEEKIDLLSRKN